MFHVIQSEGHILACHDEHYCIHQCIFLSLSLEREAMHVKLGELKKTKFRRIQEIHIQNRLLLFFNLLIC